MTKLRKKLKKAAEKEDSVFFIHYIFQEEAGCKPVFSFIGGIMYKIMTVLILCGMFYAMGYFTEIMLEFFQEEEDEDLHRGRIS